MFLELASTRQDDSSAQCKFFEFSALDRISCQGYITPLMQGFTWNFG